MASAALAAPVKTVRPAPSRMVRPTVSARALFSTARSTRALSSSGVRTNTSDRKAGSFTSRYTSR